ncbi:MAG: hypothetical protein PHD88_03680 [Firmicutes bacterium]|nr:hypothetical protein [Bacillota bacterium]MDD4262879.1 hypothetical protein [Bacillota bacterium]MDD4693491.1 hypothetical protein [Bacillota bacterium]
MNNHQLLGVLVLFLLSAVVTNKLKQPFLGIISGFSSIFFGVFLFTKVPALSLEKSGDIWELQIAEFSISDYIWPVIFTFTGILILVTSFMFYAIKKYHKLNQKEIVLVKETKEPLDKKEAPGENKPS